MNTGIKDDAYHVQNICFYCQTIVEFTSNSTYEEFKENNQLNFATSFALGKVGEEVTKLTDEFKTKYSSIPWHNIIGIRHRLVRDYAGSNLRFLWEVAKDGIPRLLEEINKTLKTH